MSAIAVEFTRKKLYEEIWKLSVAGVARKYGIPYAKCLAQVKEAQIPVPPSGYWTKINFGKLVEQTPLPGDGDATVILQKDDSQRANPTGWEETCQASPSKANPGPEIPMVFSPVEPATQAVAEEEAGQGGDTPLETVQRWGQTFYVYDRETLYREVWESPVTEVAKRYKLSDAAIHKICQSLNIPIPPLGYGRKLLAGKPVKKPPLPPGGELKKVGVQTDTGTSNRGREKAVPLGFLPEEERQVVLNVAAQILLPQENDRMRPELWPIGKRSPSGVSANASKSENSAQDGIEEETVNLRLSLRREFQKSSGPACSG